MGITIFPEQPLSVNSLPRTSPEDFDLQVSRAKFGGYTCVHKFGHNADTGTPVEDVWSVGGTLTWLLANTAMEVISSGNDTSAGSGARTIVIEGLDGSFNRQSETVTLNAGTQATANSYTRINRAYVTSSGTYHGVNANNIDIQVTSGGAIQARIDAGQGQTEKSHYTIPAGFTGFLQQYSASVNATKTADVSLWQYQNADDVTVGFDGSMRLIGTNVGLEGGFINDFRCYPRLPEKTDIWWTAMSSAGNSNVEATYDIVIVPN